MKDLEKYCNQKSINLQMVDHEKWLEDLLNLAQGMTQEKLESNK